MVIFYHKNITRVIVQNLLAWFEAQPTASATSSIDSTDLYKGDDARRYLHEWDEVLGHHWVATQETERLEAALATSQTALAAMERESSAARMQLAEYDARVIGRIL